jgi:DNA-binding IclR family transcriptional regulator
MANSADRVVKSADRTIELLEFIGRAGEPPCFAQMSRELGIPKSSLFQLLTSLSRRGYVEQVSARGGYRLGSAVVDLAQHVLNPDNATTRLEPVIRELSASLNETCGFYVRSGDFAELTLASTAWHPLKIEMPLGRLMPLYAASHGRVILAELSDEQLDAYIARTTFDPFTPNTIRSGGELRDKIDQIRHDGFSHSESEFAVGIMSFAVALREGGRVLGSMGVILPTARYTEPFGVEARRQLLATALRFEHGCVGRAAAAV